MQIWYSYFRYTGGLFLGYALFVASCDIFRASRKAKKERLNYRKNMYKNLRKGHYFLTARPPFYVIFCCFLRLLPSPSKVPYLLNDHLVFCGVIPWMKDQKCDNLLQFNTSWFGSLRTRYYFRLTMILWYQPSPTEMAFWQLKHLGRWCMWCTLSFLIVYKHRLIKLFYLIYTYFCYIYINIYIIYIYIYIYKIIKKKTF